MIDPKQQIYFQKPNFRQLRAEGYTCIDIHSHSNYSDGINKVSTILKKVRKLGIGLALTDHNEIKGSIAAYLSRNDTPIIPGIEVTTKESIDLLLYFYSLSGLIEFYEKYIKNYKHINPCAKTKQSITTILEASEKYNCLCIAAHPCVRVLKNLQKNLAKHHLSPLLNNIEGIEVINSTMKRVVNRRAILLAKNLDAIFTGGSDAHSLGEFGKTVTCVRGNSIEEILNSIKKKQNIVIGKEVKLPFSLVRHTSIAAFHLRYTRPFLQEKWNMAKNKLIKRPADPLHP